MFPRLFSTGKQKNAGPLSAAFFPAAALMGIFALTRAVLTAMAWPDLEGRGGVWIKTLWAALRLDAAMALLLALPFALWIAAASDRFRASRLSARVLAVAWGCFLFFFVFVAALETAFFDEFNSRFNSIAVDYLLYPTEVAGNIWQSYPVLWVLFGVAATAGLIGAATVRGFLRRAARPAPPARRWRSAGVFALAAVGGVGLAPYVKPEVSGNRLQNEIAANGPYAFFYAFWSNDLPYGHFYRTIPSDEALRRTLRLVRDRESGGGAGTASPTLERTQREKGRLDRPNIVIVLEESFGANFTGVLGHHPDHLTPFFDRLAADGILFTNFYATGSRTVRGLEAILCGFPPVPGESIVKRNRSENVFSLAQALKDQGYETMFVYGGRGLFDNMRPFLRANGFDRFVEQKDFASPRFTTIWGVCDEDIFDRALEEFDAFHARGRRFFGTVLSVSNHKPYTYPPGRIDLDPQRRRREHAVKYADWALGQFFEKAKSHAFFKNTVFVIIGDHGARVYGADFIPIHSYEVPFLIYAPELLKPRRVDVLGSSLDVAPTLMGLTDMSYRSVFFGRDLWDVAPRESYALLQHDRDVGILRGDRLAVLGIHQSARVYRYDRAARKFSSPLPLGPVEEELIRDGVALYQTAYALYQSRRYRLEPAPVPAR